MTAVATMPVDDCVKEFGLTDEEYVKLTDLALKSSVTTGASAEEMVRQVMECGQVVELADLIRHAIQHPEYFEELMEDVNQDTKQDA